MDGELELYTSHTSTSTWSWYPLWQDKASPLPHSAVGQKVSAAAEGNTATSIKITNAQPLLGTYPTGRFLSLQNIKMTQAQSQLYSNRRKTVQYPMGKEQSHKLKVTGRNAVRLRKEGRNAPYTDTERALSVKVCGLHSVRPPV